MYQSLCITKLLCILILAMKYAKSMDPTPEEVLKVIEEIQNVKIRGSTLEGRTERGDLVVLEERKGRKTLPVDWATQKYSDLTCGGSYDIGKEGFKGFLFDSKEKRCDFQFFGSKILKCTVALLCSGEIEFAPSKEGNNCVDEFLAISDGTIGRMGGCDKFSFRNRPRFARNGGEDLYVFYQGKSLDSPCAVFCKEDLESGDYPDIGAPKKISEYKGFKNFPVQDSCKCGKRQHTDGRIIGGEEVTKFDYPWLGALVFPFKWNNRTPFCGGSLITDQHVITAAHCLQAFVIKEEIYKIQVLLHAHLMNKPFKIPDGFPEVDIISTPGWNLTDATDEDENSIRIYVHKMIIHPLFNNSLLRYDVAILELAETVNFARDKISPICLPLPGEFKEFQEGEEMTLSGWGRTVLGLPVHSRLLQKADFKFIEWGECAYLSFLDYTHLCAGHLPGGKGSCHGDSGGPLIYKIDEVKNQYMLAGLLVGTHVCGGENSPSVYTNLHEIVQWVYYQTADSDAMWCAR